MPSSRPELRAGDADRDRVAELLRRHYADGRLTSDEFSQRTDAAYAARTYGELDALTTDLPALPAAATPVAPVARRRGEELAKERREFHGHLIVYAVINLALVVIWALTSHGGDFWPVWPLLGWGIGLTLHGASAYTGLDIGRPRHGPLAIPERLSSGELRDRGRRPR